MAAHSKIGASSMHRWAACPASVRLSANIPPTSSSYAEEGTRAHEAAADWLTNGRCPEGLDDEMVEAVQVYVEAIQNDWKEASPGDSKMLIEHRFDLSSLHPGLFGTADCVQYYANLKLLRVWDYKHGAGVSVDVKENEQLQYYGLGALLSTGFPCEDVELVIVQPRCPHSEGVIRRWRFKSYQLIDFSADLIDAAKRTEDPNAPIVPGDHCRFCPAGGICPALHERATAVAKYEFGAHLSYDPKKLSEILTWLPSLEAYIKNVREFAYGEAQHGRCPPGFKLVAKRATRRWRDEGGAAAVLNNKYGISLTDIYDRKIKSPAQMEKAVPKELRPALGELVVSESSGLTLAEESDPRPQVKADAVADFKEVTEMDILS